MIRPRQRDGPRQGTRAAGDLDTDPAAQLDHDLGLNAPPEEEVFDEFVLHVDGWLCEIKDAQIRDGLHVLGQPPQGEELINLVLAVLRSPQVFGGQVNGVPGLENRTGPMDAEPVEGGRASMLSTLTHGRRRGAGPHAC